MKNRIRSAVSWLFALGLCPMALAGGSGLNTVVVVNQRSTNSVELGNYYCERRGVPPQNLLRINWTGSRVDWTRNAFETTLRAPLNAMLAARQLTNQIDYILLSMDIPYRVTESTGVPETSGVNSTTSALFYGFKLDGNCSQCPVGLFSCNLAPGSTNLYAGSEGVFRQTPPINATSNSWLVMMLTASNLARAKEIVDRGVASDGSFPTQTVVLGKGQDRLRNIRFYHFDDALMNVRLKGGMNILRTNTSSVSGIGPLLGLQNGEQSFSLASDQFVPGALADDLTSFGGVVFEYNGGQTHALDFLNAGAVASIGTVIEPCAYFEKFASPQLYFYQSRGFSAAECYYLSVTNPYQGLLLGEPLSAPFASAMSGDWHAPTGNSIVSGIQSMIVNFSAIDAGHPIQQVDLFLDGIFHSTLTNIPPTLNNALSVTINGFSTTFKVFAGSTTESVASSLATRINVPNYTDSTKVRAIAHGDRVELQSLDISRAGIDTTVTASSSIGTGSFLSTFVSASRGDFLDHVAYGLRSYFITNSAGSAVPLNAYLQLMVLKTNGSPIVIAVTNTVPGMPLNVLARTLFDGINTNTALQSPDGLVVEDINLHDEWPYNQYVYGSNDFSGEFNLRARSLGWPESQIQVWLSGSPALVIQPAGTNRLDENIADLRPRDHLYVTAGLTNLEVTFPFDTTSNADGYHELTAVAYEGSHVRTQTRVQLPIRIQNNNWAATFTTLLGGSNTAVEATIQFAVVANTDGIARIELFTTGGLYATTSNASSATFSVAATNLGVGLHPFYAVVTDSNGKQYRTETKWLRIVGEESPFMVTVAGVGPTLIWPATAGRSYQVLSSPAVTNIYVQRAIVTPTNTAASWSETNSAPPQQFYRVKTP